MLTELFYKETPYLKINNLEVIGDTFLKGNMTQHNQKWIYYKNISEGVYKYKFLINGKLELNDPLAYEYMKDNNEIWSVLIIDKNGNRIYQKRNPVRLLNYSLGTEMNVDKSIFNKKIFNTQVYDKVVARFEFAEIVNNHCITVAWYNPYGILYEYSENMLFTKEKETVLWFWIDLLCDMMEGKWIVKLFVDGQFLLKEEFDIFHYINSEYIGNLNILL